MAATSAPRLSALGFVRLLGRGRKPLEFKRGEVIFGEGDRKDAIFYLEHGSVKLTVTSKHGREAIIGIISSGEFLGEAAVAGEGTRAHRAVALTDSRVLRIERDLMMNTLNGNMASLFFIRCLLHRNAATETALSDTLLYSGEKRLARTLLCIIDKGKGRRVTKVSQQMLAEMTGITRQRVNLLMQNMKKQGVVDFAPGGRGYACLRRIARTNGI